MSSKQLYRKGLSLTDTVMALGLIGLLAITMLSLTNFAGKDQRIAEAKMHKAELALATWGKAITGDTSGVLGNTQNPIVNEASLIRSFVDMTNLPPSAISGNSVKIADGVTLTANWNGDTLSSSGNACASFTLSSSSGKTSVSSNYELYRSAGIKKIGSIAARTAASRLGSASGFGADTKDYSQGVMCLEVGDTFKQIFEAVDEGNNSYKYILCKNQEDYDNYKNGYTNTSCGELTCTGDSCADARACKNEGCGECIDINYCPGATFSYIKDDTLDQRCSNSAQHGNIIRRTYTNPDFNCPGQMAIVDHCCTTYMSWIDGENEGCYCDRSIVKNAGKTFNEENAHTKYSGTHSSTVCIACPENSKCEKSNGTYTDDCKCTACASPKVSNNKSGTDAACVCPSSKPSNVTLQISEKWNATSPTCKSCKPGYELKDGASTCTCQDKKPEDIVLKKNEQWDTTKSTCKSCKDGYRYNNKGECIEIEKHRCAINVACTNTGGVYTSECTCDCSNNKTYSNKKTSTGSDASARCVCNDTIEIDAGNQYDKKAKNCFSKCPEGYYSAGGENATCVKCNAPMVTDKTTGATSCTCPTDFNVKAGYGKDNNSASCQTICPTGYYSAGGKNATCVKCNAPMVTDKTTGATSCTCPTVFNVSAGYSKDNNSASCQTICPTGYYSAGGENATCSKCDSPKVTDKTTGATSCTCPTDFNVKAGYGKDNSSASCQTICPTGYYSAGGKNATCQQCPNPKTTNSTGTTKASSCVCPNTKPSNVTLGKNEVWDTTQTSCIRTKTVPKSCADPKAIVISNEAELKLIGKNSLYPLNGSYCLEENIEITGTFPSIGTFEGQFDGNGKKISNLNNNGAGLFTEVKGDNASVHDLTVSGKVKGSDGCVGGVIGSLTSGNIYNVTSNVSVNINQTVGESVSAGAMLGCQKGGNISNSGVGENITVSVTGSGATIFAGGFTGSQEKGSVTSCFSKANITVKDSTGSDVYAGGFIGLSGGTVSSSFSTGNIKADVTGNNTYAGGFVGKNIGIIASSYSTNTLKCNSGSLWTYVGGFVGYSSGMITYSYSSGNKSSKSSYATNWIHLTSETPIKSDKQSINAGGFVGLNNGSMSQAYTQTSIQIDIINNTQKDTMDVYAGGFTGLNNGTIEDAYTTGELNTSGISNVNDAGFAGSNNGQIANTYAIGKNFSGKAFISEGKDSVNSYWDINTSNQSNGTGAIGLTTKQMQVSRSTLKNHIYSQWSDNVWCFGDAQYPILKGLPAGNQYGITNSDTCQGNVTTCGKEAEGDYTTGCTCKDKNIKTYDVRNNECHCFATIPSGVTLKENEQWDTTKSTCKSCESGYKYSGDSCISSISCTAPKVPDSSNTTCVCPSSKPSNVTLVANEQWDTTKSTCKSCKDKYVYDKSGNCVEPNPDNCPAGTYAKANIISDTQYKNLMKDYPSSLKTRGGINNRLYYKDGSRYYKIYYSSITITKKDGTFTFTYLYDKNREYQSKTATTDKLYVCISSDDQCGYSAVNLYTSLTANTTITPYTCTPCPKGTYQPKTGQTECIPCEGTVVNNKCIPCEAGTYAKENIISDAQYEKLMKDYPDYLKSRNAINDRLYYNNGSSYRKIDYSSIKRNWDGTFTYDESYAATTDTIYVCRKSSCGSSSYSSSDYTSLTADAAYTCVPCPAGTYQPKTGQTECIPCEGTVVNNKCIPCEAGTYAKENIISDAQYEKLVKDYPDYLTDKTAINGRLYYKEGHNYLKIIYSSITRNWDGTFTFKCSRVGSTTTETTDTIYVCEDYSCGYYSDYTPLTADTTPYTCTPCPAGTYQPKTGQTECIPCKGTVIDNECIPCEAGTYTKENIISDAQYEELIKDYPKVLTSKDVINNRLYYDDDPIDYSSIKRNWDGTFTFTYKDFFGTQTATTGTIDVCKDSICIGSCYTPLTADTTTPLYTCTPCPARTYQPKEGQLECIPCKGTVVNNGCIPCKAGTYAKEDIISDAQYEELMKYYPAYLTDKTAINGRLYYKEYSSYYSIDYSTITRNNGTFAFKYKDTFGWETAATDKIYVCKDSYCGSGSSCYTPLTATTIGIKYTCIPCPKGTFQHREGQTECFKCDKGYYQDKIGQTSCIDCGYMTKTYYEGSTSKSDCMCDSSYCGSDQRMTGNAQNDSCYCKDKTTSSSSSSENPSSSGNSSSSSGCTSYGVIPVDAGTCEFCNGGSGYFLANTVKDNYNCTITKYYLRDTDPLILDLKGDGLRLTDFENAVLFDIWAKGTQSLVDWTDVQTEFDDAFLCWDKNNNGIIDDGSELFGDNNGAKTGVDELAKYDSNNDGIIDKNDAIFDKLLLWVDFNSDAITDKGELRTLKDMNIKSISTKYKIEYDQYGEIKRDKYGNTIGYVSEFTYEKQNDKGIMETITGAAYDVFFKAVHTFGDAVHTVGDGVENIRSILTGN